ncbi:MAG: glycosyltransferase, partial [Acidobacteriota bacterium]
MNKNYRIFHLIKGLGRGGAEKLLSEGARYRNRAKFDYGYGYFLDWKNALVADLEDSGSEVFCFNCNNPASILLSPRRLSKFLKGWGADLIHCHLPLAGIAGRMAGRMAGIPVIYTEHNLQERYHPLTRRLNLWTWNLQKKVVAVSAEVAESIRSVVNSGVVPVQIVQNGIAAESFVPSEADRIAIRQDLKIPYDAPVVGTVAGFRRQKKLADWLKAASLILKTFPDCHFVIIGDGPLRRPLEADVKTLRLSKNVHFTGVQQNVIPFYSTIDVYMISSVFEGLPIALLEAMAMRLPVVTTPAGGIPEVVIDGHTGFLVDFGFPQKLADKVSLLIEHPDL